MTQAQNGNTVQVHYTGKLDDGTTFDSSHGREPLEFTIGMGQMIPGFEAGVIGMEPGQSKTITISPEDAYGSHDPERVIGVPRSEIPSNIPLERGMVLQATQSNGGMVEFTVLDVGDRQVTLDGNHPLAGQSLTFEIQVVNVT